MLSFIGVVAGLLFPSWRAALFYPFEILSNLILLSLDVRQSERDRSRLRWNAAFWDEGQGYLLHGLDSHLLLIAERSDAESKRALGFLNSSRQQWAKYEALLQLDAKVLAQCDTIKKIRNVSKNLRSSDEGGRGSSIVREFSRISEDVQSAWLQAKNLYNQSVALASAEERMDVLIKSLVPTKYPDRIFLLAAERWRQILGRRHGYLLSEIEIAAAVDKLVPNPYFVGVPISNRPEVFVGRTNIIDNLMMLLNNKKKIHMLLYGQFRMGKTSFLLNVKRLLKDRGNRTVLPIYIECRGLGSAEDHFGFFTSLMGTMVDMAQELSEEHLSHIPTKLKTDQPFLEFHDWLVQFD